MKNVLKQTVSVLVALALTVYGVVALSMNATAASSQENVGYTVSQTYHDFDHNETTAPKKDYTEPTTFPDTIMPFYNRYITASVAFKDDAIVSYENFKKDSDHRYRMYLTLKNVEPSGNGNYYFVIPYTTFDGGWYVDGIKTDGNKEYQSTGGKWFAFNVHSKCDVTIEWDVYDGYVGIVSYMASMVSSNLPFNGIDEGTTVYDTTDYEPETEPETACVDGVFVNCYVEGTIRFRNNALDDVFLTESDNNRLILTGELDNVPASDKIYYFVIDYEATDAGGIWRGVKAVGNGLYNYTGGTYFAFYKTKNGKVSFTWDKRDPDSVTITGDGVIPMNSQIPFDGDLNSTVTEPYTLPAPDVTYPSDTIPIASTAVAATSTPAANFEMGDANMDGRVNINDATAVQRYLARIITFSDEQKKLADLSGDGQVTIKDATLIQKVIAHMAI